MSLSIDNAFTENSYTSCITPDYQSKNTTTQEFQIENKSTQNTSESTQNSEDSNKDENKVRKKMQIIYEIEGQYYCTYLVDEEGQKVKLSQVPISKAGIQNKSQNSIESLSIKSSDYNLLKDAHISFELKQQLNLEVNHKQNVRDMMDLINGKNNSNGILGTLKSIRHLVM